VSIPTFNRSGFIEAAIRSALEQTYEPLEVIVVDDASTDDTVERVLSYNDSRLRLYVNEHTLGQSGNRNRALALAQGELIKFLDSDDLLEPHCAAAMAELFAEDSAVGLVFGRRRVVLEEPDTEAQTWLARYGDLHTRFATLDRVNDGRVLFAQWLAAGLHGNWIGEPSAVMVRRSHVETTGGFSLRAHQTIDSDLWVRLLPHALVGFVDEPLATYRHGPVSEHVTNSRTRRGWLDRLWTLEALTADAEIRQAYPEVAHLLDKERRQAWRTTARLGRLRGEQNVPVRPYLGYLGFRLRSIAGLHPVSFPKVPARTTSL
jgi:glycosyltransferase involved in cell wall biosynthesis